MRQRWEQRALCVILKVQCQGLVRSLPGHPKRVCCTKEQALIWSQRLIAHEHTDIPQDVIRISALTDESSNLVPKGEKLCVGEMVPVSPTNC